METSLEELGARAEQVAADYAKRQTAHEEQLAAEAALLTAVIERVRPALRALGERPIVHRRSTADRVDDVEERHALRMVCLTDDRFRPERLGAPQNSRGKYGKCDLGLAEDGSLYELTYSGHWSAWQGEADEWTAEVALVSPKQVAADYKVESLAAQISELLDKQLAGKSAQTTQAALDRAEKMRAIAALAKK